MSEKLRSDSTVGPKGLPTLRAAAWTTGTKVRPAVPPVDLIARDGVSRYPLPPVLYRLLGLNVPGVEDAPEAGAVLAEVVARDADLVRRLRFTSGVDAPWRDRTERRPLEAAVLSLGFRRVHTAALAITVIGGLPVKTTVVDYLRFWRYSVAVAYLTQSVAYHRHVEGVEFGAAAGLFHDVGRLLMEDADPEGMQRARARQIAGEGPWLQVEREELGFTAYELTVALLKAWEFPERLVATVVGLGSGPDTDLSDALRDAMLTARALDFATKTGRRAEVVPDVQLVIDRYFGGVEGFTERVDAMLGAAMIATSLSPEDTPEGAARTPPTAG